MEIPVMNRISGFEAGISRLQNPSFVSRLIHLSGFEEISQIYSLWTWGALILAFLATFSSIIRRTKLLFFRFCNGRSVTSEPLDDEKYDDEDESCSSSSSDDEDDPTSPFENQRPVEEDFRVADSDFYGEYQRHNRKLKLRRRCSIDDRFSWSDFANGQSVVKLWDGLGLGFENSSGTGSLSSMWGQNPAVSMMSPAIIVSAGLENSRNVALRVSDVRVGRQIPVVLEECQPRRRRIVGICSGGVEKVYVMDDASSLQVRDMRNFNSPLKVLTESDGNTWWDADAVSVSHDDGEDGCFSLTGRR